MKLKSILMIGAMSATVAPLWTAQAQTAAAPADNSQDAEAANSGLEEITVTARRRDENLQDVPVVVTAFSQKMIEEMGINSITDVAALTPGFRGYTDGGGASQGSVAIRGVSTGFVVTGGNQAVSLNVDGVQLSQAGSYRAAQIDLQSIEVLKGPQALFFGKNNTGGIVSIRSADPTSSMFAEFRGGYEFTSDRRYGQMIVSGPVTDTLGVRAVAYYGKEEGYQKNITAFPVANRRLADSQEFFSRFTVAWNPSDTFTAKGKVSYYKRNGDSREPGAQRVNCVLPRLSEDCTADNRVAIADVPGRPSFSNYDQFQAVLDLQAKLAEGLTLNSVTGYQDNNSAFAGDSTAGELIAVATGFGGKYRTFSEELRLSSDFDGPLNFTAGGLYEKSEVSSFNVKGYELTIYSPAQFLGGAPGAPGPGFVQSAGATQTVKSDTYSAFGQLSFKPVETLEIAGGVRYSKIDSSYSGSVYYAGTLPFALAQGQTGVAPLGAIPTSRPQRTFTNWSPEATVTWRPQDNVTVFGAYKQGFKAGGFDLSVTTNPYLGRNPIRRDITYGAEGAEGGEVGFKTEWFDRSLRLNASAYSYNYSDLQLSAFDPASVAVRVTNAGKSRVRGAELELLYAPPALPGLSVSGGVNYNQGRFMTFIADCTQSQIAGLQSGCVERNGLAGLQTTDGNNVAGQPLPFAPDWSGNFGIAYDSGRKATGNVAFRGNILGVFSSSYNANPSGGNDPLHVQKGYVTWNAGLGLYSTKDAWEVNFRIDNLTNKYYRQLSTDIPNSPREVQALISPPRMFSLELVLRPSAM